MKIVNKLREPDIRWSSTRRTRLFRKVGDLGRL